MKILRILPFDLVFVAVSGFEKHTTVHGGDEEGRNDDESRFHGGWWYRLLLLLSKFTCQWVWVG